mgnify:CR=1 FL=1
MTPESLAALHAKAMEFPAPWSAAEFESLLESKTVFVIPADADQTEAGFALGRIVLDEAELLTIAIAPNLRRRGLGRKCLNTFEAEAANLGAINAHLEVAASNVAARTLYARNGWLETGLRKAYYRTPSGRIDAILMQKPLTTD